MPSPLGLEDDADMVRKFGDSSEDANVIRALAERTLSEDDIHVLAGTDDSFWKPALFLQMSDKAILDKPNEWLNDRLIFAGMLLLKKDFANIAGFSDPVMLAASRCTFQGQAFVQVLHNDSAHWVTTANLNCPVGVVRVYDSLHCLPNQCVKNTLALMCHTPKSSLEVQSMDVARQLGLGDCGLMALAFATTRCFGQDPVNCNYDQSRLRSHLLECIEKGKLTQFPVICNRMVKKGIAFKTCIKIYCTCRQTYVTGQSMIQCHSCREWFHATCLKLSDSAFDDAAAQTDYTCNRCMQ